MRLLFSILFCLSFISVEAQITKSDLDLSGRWTGVITQDEGGFRSLYDFEIFIQQDGKNITGKSYVQIEEIGVYAVMEFKGKLRGNLMVMLDETRIIDHKKTEDMEWCIKKMQLMVKYKDDKLHLDGFWSGSSVIGPCIPGKITLTKAVPRV